MSNIVIDTIDRLIRGNPTIDGGRAILHTMFPNEFEYYLIAFELLDSDNNTDGYIVLPILPSSISETVSPLVKVSDTIRGVDVINNEKFVPVDISMSGTFGVSLKVLSSMKNSVGSHNYLDIESVANNLFGLSAFDGVGSESFVKKSYKSGSRELSAKIKSGWGVMKLFESILKRDGELDKNGKPKVLCMYNMATGNHYVVVVTAYSFSLSEKEYATWRYSVNLKGVAPLDWYIQSRANSDSPVVHAFASGAIQSGANRLMSDIMSRVL